MRLLIILIIFILGILYCMHSSSQIHEGFDNNVDCPNLLVQKGKELHLLYTNKAKIPGVNPIKFDNLEDYVEFIKWQRAKGIRCPILHYQQTYDTQNNLGYKNVPEITGVMKDRSNAVKSSKDQPLYDANHDDGNYNKNSYPGFDGEDQYVGANTPLDKIFESDKEISANAMDSNWGGIEYSEDMIEKGVFKENTRSIHNTLFDHNIEGGIITTDNKNQATTLDRDIATRYGGQIENTPVSRTLS